MIFTDNVASAEVPVTIGSTQYILREARSGTVTKYRDYFTKNATLQQAPDGKLIPVQMGAISEAEPFLVGECLYTTGDRPRKVGLAVALDLPNRVVKALHTRIKEMSDMDEGDRTVENVDAEIEVLKAEKASLEELVKNG